MSMVYYRKIKEIGFNEPVDGVVGLRITPLKPLSGDPDQEPEPLLFGLSTEQAKAFAERLLAILQSHQEVKH